MLRSANNIYYRYCYMDCDLWLEGLSKVFNGLVGQKNGQIIK